MVAHGTRGGGRWPTARPRGGGLGLAWSRPWEERERVAGLERERGVKKKRE